MTGLDVALQVAAARHPDEVTVWGVDTRPDTATYVGTLGMRDAEVLRRNGWATIRRAFTSTNHWVSLTDNGLAEARRRADGDPPAGRYATRLEQLLVVYGQINRLHPAGGDSWKAARDQARRDVILDAAGADMLDGEEQVAVEWMASHTNLETVARLAALLDRARGTS